MGAWVKGTKGKSCQAKCASIGKTCDDASIKKATLDSSCSVLKKMFPGKNCCACGPSDSSNKYCFPGWPGSSCVYYHKSFHPSQGQELPSKVRLHRQEMRRREHQ